MYICEKCGEIFEEPKVIGNDVDRGEVCPGCGRCDFDEAERCEKCGEWVSVDKIHGYGGGPYICEECLDEYKYDLPTLLKATEDEKFDFEIPALARYLLTDEDINALIEKELERRVKRATDKFLPNPFDFDPTDFMKDYANDIADYIGREVL